MQRVDLERERHAERQRWRNGGEWEELAVKVALGELADGRWYVRRYGGKPSHLHERTGLAYSGPAAEHYARGTARRWMRTIGGKWVEA